MVLALEYRSKMPRSLSCIVVGIEMAIFVMRKLSLLQSQLYEFCEICKGFAGYIHRD